MGGKATHGIVAKTGAQGGKEQSRVSLPAIVTIEKIRAGWDEQARAIGLQAQGIHRRGQGAAGEVLAGQ